MGDRTKIEWTRGDDGSPGATWNPVTGCTEVSPGCDHCYAKTFAERWRGTAGHYFENGFDITLRPEKLHLPLRWRKPRRIFVNSLGDLFHERVPDEFIAEAFAVMAIARQHSYQVLTKRHARMRSILNSREFRRAVQRATLQRAGDRAPWLVEPWWPLRNVWLGVSVENQKWADIRIPALLETPAAVRWLSCEPLLGPVDLSHWLGPVDWPECFDDHAPSAECSRCIQPEWVVAGGESGHGARPMHPAWARTLRDHCAAAGVPFHFKQWGQHTPVNDRPNDGDLWVNPDGTTRPWEHGDGHIRVGGGDFTYRGAVLMRRTRSKHDAGRQLDGHTHDAYPAARP